MHAITTLGRSLVTVVIDLLFLLLLGLLFSGCAPAVTPTPKPVPMVPQTERQPVEQTVRADRTGKPCTCPIASQRSLRGG